MSRVIHPPAPVKSPAQQFPERLRVMRSAHANGRRVFRKAAPFVVDRTGACYTVRTSAGVFHVVDDGARWKPGDPIPEGRQPNALRALARHAERHAEEEACREERRAA